MWVHALALGMHASVAQILGTEWAMGTGALGRHWAHRTAAPTGERVGQQTPSLPRVRDTKRVMLCRLRNEADMY